MSNVEDMEVTAEENLSDLSSEEDSDDDEPDQSDIKEVYLPGKPLEEGEELVCDSRAYHMLHQAQTGAPCLSFDIIKDNLGENRESYPLCAFIVAGTQATQAHVNNIVVMKLSNLHRTSKEGAEDEDDNESDEEEENDKEKHPKMKGALLKHQGCVNRVRATTLNGKVIAASWSELGRVNLFDLSEQLDAVESDQNLFKYNKENKSNTLKPIFTFTGHQKEGFGLDWSPLDKGVLASGDCKRDVHIWKPIASSWQVDQRALMGHTASVEDLQWSPTERSVLASCSVDRSVRIWDTRAPPQKACMLTATDAHSSDVNVISWNRNEPFIVSGGDDGFLHVWDLRRFKESSPVATFKHHTQPVTTVEWHPSDSAVFASGGSDNQIAIWDLSVEKDADAIGDELEDVPPQLLFIHQGQKDIKELHWHPQLPGVIISTALNGFNIFRTISV